MNTEIGKIQAALADIENEESPLSQRLNEFGDVLAKIIGVICLLVWLVNFRNFFDPVHKGAIRGCLYYFKVAVALAVAAIPEGLPAVITTSLALGARRMVKQQAIVRKIATVETLGCTNVICSDKTGTLTTNEMVVREFCLFGDNPTRFLDYTVSGVSFQPTGEVSGMQKGDIDNLKNLRLFCESVVLNNQAVLLKKDDKLTKSGLPTEAALKVLVEKFAQYDNQNLSADPEAYGKFLTQNYQKLVTLEFTPERKAMSVLCQNLQTNKNVMFLKGAPERLIKSAAQVVLKNGEIVPLDKDDKIQILQKVKKMASKGYRTLAIAYKENCGQLDDYKDSTHPSHSRLALCEDLAEFEQDPILIGIVGIQDPPREGV